ncbi:ABC transporter substrate-binding protein [Spartinivicinus ruber]|uniref:ABC transporter substrate-binding protein n=1 Tax=Spartinivicinus ruber TaxID=2683272 RepID=UPI0013D0B268|nr:ABC transporter substrate-binding protein [Spartinivicinus ruber]
MCSQKYSYYLLIILAFTCVPLWASAQLTIVTLADKDLTHVRVMEKTLAEAYKLLSIPIELKVMPNKRSLVASNSGRVDGEAGRIAGMEKEYPNLIMVPEFLYSLPVFVYSKNERFTIEGWENLRPYRIGVLRGAKYAEIGSKGMDTLKVSYGIQLFKALEAGRIDVAVLHESGNLALSGVKGIRILQPPLQEIIIFNCAIKKVKNKKISDFCSELLKSYTR